jgi:hypothetical protein
VRERDVELHLVHKVRAAGGLAYKFVSPGHRGVPDRIVLMPDGKVWFVELKAPGKKPTEQQLRVHAKFACLGQVVVVLDDYESVDDWVRGLCFAEDSKNEKALTFTDLPDSLKQEWGEHMKRDLLTKRENQDG